jgi:hypothetical protein
MPVALKIILMGIGDFHVVVPFFFEHSDFIKFSNTLQIVA